MSAPTARKATPKSEKREPEIGAKSRKGDPKEQEKLTRRARKERRVRKTSPKSKKSKPQEQEKQARSEEQEMEKYCWRGKG